MNSKQGLVLRTRILIATMLGLVLPAIALAQPASEPARGRGQQLPVVQRFMAFSDRMRQAVDDLKLTEEQKQQIQSMVQSAQKELRDMVPQLLQVDPPARQQKARAMLEELSRKIESLLSAEQVQTFRDRVEQIRRDLSPNAGPATQPALPPRVATAIERLNDYLSQLTLTDQQKQQIETLFANTRKQVQEMQQQARGDMAAVGDQMQAAVQGLRRDLADILTPQQLQRLRELINQGGPIMDGARGGRGPGAMMQPDMMGPGNATVAEKPAEPDAPMIEIGQPAPNLTLNRLDAAPIQLSAFKGKFVLLIFGSYSSPSFRQRAAALEQLKKDYSGRVSIFLIYTSENYPIGNWTVDRNKADGIFVEQPTDLAGRQKMAKQAREALKLTVPTAIDSMDDFAAKTYGGTTNAAYLIGREGSVVARQRWFDPYAMRRAMDDAIKQATRPEGSPAE